jgi:predicted transposase YdaD
MEIQGVIFDKLFAAATINKLTPHDMRTYNKSITEYADVKRIMVCSREEGMAMGIEKGMERGMAEGMERGIEKGIAKGIERGIEKGIAKGMERGMEAGLLSKSLEVAQNLLNLNMPVTDIVKITGLTPAQIQQINRITNK